MDEPRVGHRGMTQRLRDVIGGVDCEMVCGTGFVEGALTMLIFQNGVADDN